MGRSDRSIITPADLAPTDFRGCAGRIILGYTSPIHGDNSNRRIMNKIALAMVYLTKAICPRHAIFR
jgi:hypothetical protein